MADNLFNFQRHDPNFDQSRGRVRALRLKNFIPFVAFAIFLYFWWFSSMALNVVKNRSIFSLNDVLQNMNDTHIIDVAILKSLPKSRLNLEEVKVNGGTEVHVGNDTTVSSLQLNNIVDALIGAGDFAGWANLLSSSDLPSLPVSATLFIPGNHAISNVKPGGDPLVLPYHIVPQRLSFSDLQQFKLHTRLPTLLPSKFIWITNNSESNFTIDDSQITYPDVYASAGFTVHGVNKVLDYNAYGSADPLLLLSPPPKMQNASVVATQTESVMPALFPDEWSRRTTSNSTTRILPAQELSFIFYLLWVVLLL